jgi:HEAT repeat protein
VRPLRPLTAAVILATALAACSSKPKEPDVPNLIADLKSADPETRGKANLAVMDAGEKAVPASIEMLQGPDPVHRATAARALYGMGGRGRQAVPALAVLLSDAETDNRVAAAMALENMGPDAAEAVPALIKALKDKEGLVRQRSVIALGNIGPAARSAVPALGEAARWDPVRQSAEAAIQKIQARQ